MFAVNSTPYNFATLFDTLQGLEHLQQQQRQLQLQDTRPKIVKKVETEDAYQIQIFKKNGNFNSYEVKVLRNTHPFGYKSNLVSLVIQSDVDEFRKVFQFNLDDIEVSQIDWEYYKNENVLVLNVPKKVRYCSDDYANAVLAGLFGIPQCGQVCNSRSRNEERALRRQEDAELAAARKAERRRKAERKAREAEERRAEEAKRAEEARRAEEAKRAEEARKARVAEERRRREEAVRQRKHEKRQEEEYKKRVAQQQEALKQLFGTSGFFPFFMQPDFAGVSERYGNGAAESPRQEERNAGTARNGELSTSATAPEPEVELPKSPEPVSQPSSQPRSQPVSQPNVSFSEDTEMTDNESITSDVETPASSDVEEKANSLHKHPSLEEVEDEEFVMFRKKFGQ